MFVVKLRDPIDSTLNIHLKLMHHDCNKVVAVISASLSVKDYINLIQKICIQMTHSTSYENISLDIIVISTHKSVSFTTMGCSMTSFGIFMYRVEIMSGGLTPAVALRSAR